MTCDTCPAQLTAGDRRAGRRRCRTCSRGTPLILAARPTRKGHAHVSAEWTTPIGKAATAKPKAGVSWWTDFAVGDRRDAEYMAKAEALVPTQTNDTSRPVEEIA